ncbi:YybH family protein [Lysobacter fragariae]
MRFHRTGVAAAALALLMMATCLGGCSRTPPEQVLRDTVASLQHAIESRDAGAVEDLLAEDFIGPDGMDRKAARRMAQLMFLRYQDVGVTLGPVQVELRGRQATVRFTAALTGGAGMLPDSGRLYDVETAWRQVDDDWRLVNAQWTPNL